MNSLVRTSEQPVIEITNIEETCGTIKTMLESVGLPSECMFAPTKERFRVFLNFDAVLEAIPVDKIGESFYISKFIAAVFAGLFDAALNYLWDETVKELRNKVAQYDIDYFYDVALSDSGKRKDFKDVDDLKKLSDRDLLQGAKEIDLIDEVGFQELKHISYMRNWTSAAHPNEQELTGLKLIGFLETCVKNVISLPIDHTAIEIKTLLNNIRQNIPLDRERIQHIALSFSSFKKSQIEALCQGFFGIYTDLNSSEIVRDNINSLIVPLWEMVPENIKNKIGIKYGNFSINGEGNKCNLAERFLRQVDGMKYIPDDLKIAKLTPLLDDLVNAHEGFNNFYTEPSIAREIALLVKSTTVPKAIERDYVNKILYVYLTNGNGSAWHANGYYCSMIDNFSEIQVAIGISAITNSDIANKLVNLKCVEKFKEFLGRVESKVTNPIGKDFIQVMLEFNDSQFCKIMNDKTAKLKFDSFCRSYAIVE